MDETRLMLRDTVNRTLANCVTAAATLTAEKAGIDRSAWDALCKLGLDSDEMQFDHNLVVLHEIGQYAVLVPYAESQVMGGWLTAAAGFEEVALQTVAILSPSSVTLNNDGSVQINTKDLAIPWGRVADRIIFSFEMDGQAFLAASAASQISWLHRTNIAGEPLDFVLNPSIDIEKNSVKAVPATFGPDSIRLRGALCRSVQMVGAMSGVLDIALRYTHDRKQFKRSLSQFQVIQSYLAEMAGEHCASQAAVDSAERAYGEAGAFSAIAIGKIRAGQAVRPIASLGHQVHGAIGFTQEYPLHNWTRRLWAWRDEYGNEAYWAKRLGKVIVKSGPGQFWPVCTTTGWEA